MFEESCMKKSAVGPIKSIHSSHHSVLFFIYFFLILLAN